MSSFFAPHGAADLLARYSFVEPLLAGRRVLELGAVRSTEGASALALAERGAAVVVAADEDPQVILRAAQAVRHPSVQFRVAALGDLPPGAFDLVAVADGAELVASPARLAACAALLAPGGRLLTSVAVAGASGLAVLAGERPPTSAPSFESFAAALSARFSAVELATQAPAVGWVLTPADTGSEPELGIDGSLSGSPETAFYVALCGEAPANLRGMVLVTLPSAPLVEAARASAELAREHGDLQRAAREREDAAASELVRERRALLDARHARDAAREAQAATAQELEAARSALAERELQLAGAAEERAAAERAAAEASALRSAEESGPEAPTAEPGGEGGRALAAELANARSALEGARQVLLAADRQGEGESQLPALREALEEAREEALLTRSQAERDRARAEAAHQHAAELAGVNEALARRMEALRARGEVLAREADGLEERALGAEAALAGERRQVGELRAALASQRAEVEELRARLAKPSPMTREPGAGSPPGEGGQSPFAEVKPQT